MKICFRLFAYLFLPLLLFYGCDKNKEEQEPAPPVCNGECKISEYMNGVNKYVYTYGPGTDEDKIMSANIYERENSNSSWQLWGKMELEYPSESKIIFIFSTYENSTWETSSKKILTYGSCGLSKEENFKYSGSSFDPFNKFEYYCNYENGRLIEGIYYHNYYDGLEPQTKRTYTWLNGNPHTQFDYDNPYNGWEWTGHCDTIIYENGRIFEMIHHTPTSSPYNKKVYIYENDRISQIDLMLYKEGVWEKHSSSFYNYDEFGNLISIYSGDNLSEEMTYFPGTGNFRDVWNFRYVWATWIPRPN